jgi:hypothetical protein
MESYAQIIELIKGYKSHPHHFPFSSLLTHKMQNTFRDLVLLCSIPSIVTPIWAAMNGRAAVKPNMNTYQC